MFEKIKFIIICLLFAAVVLLGTLQFVGCKTQAVINDGEPGPCFHDRYRAREGFPSDTMASECANAYKWDRCMKILKENPEMFKDFNDCWRTGK